MSKGRHMRSMHNVCMCLCRGNWKRMFIHHPHMRFDGLYVSRNTYVRTGVTEWVVR